MAGTKRRQSILLIGPAGSGKSPVGAHLQHSTGWAHLDFGHRLRLIAEGMEDHGLTIKERAYIKHLLQTQSLVSNEAFHIVRKIIAAFLAQQESAPGIILNGMPRHIDQARQLEGILDVRLVVHLVCPPLVAVHRINQRVAGLSDDHAGRSDDTPDAIARRLAIFETSTSPLVEHYREHGVRILPVSIDHDTTSDDVAEIIRICIKRDLII